MWIISCLLLMLGTLSAILGISFYLRNREAAGNIRFYIFAYGVFAALWCICYGFIGLCPNVEYCGWIRKIGVIGVNAFLVNEVFLVSEMSVVNERIVKGSRAVAVTLALIDYIFYSRNGVDRFVRMDSWTTWYAGEGHDFARTLHTVYIVIIFLILISLAIAWVVNNKLKRLRHFLVMAFVSNFSLLFFCVHDTFLPMIDKPAVATSGIGAASCAFVMWYGAIKLNSFDIRTGNVKDRLFDFLEAGIIVFDANHQIAMRNHYARKVLGDEGNSTERLRKYFEINAETGGTIFRDAENGVSTTRMWDKKSGKAYSMKMQALRDNYGDIFCFMSIFVDVTEEVEAASKLAIASRAKSRFLAQMSHEIRTPINAVLGMNEMILRESNDDDILEYAASIDSAGNTLLALINSILDFSKIEDGKMEIVPVRYDTASFVNDLVNSITQRVDAKGLEFKVVIDENLPREMVGDDVRFSQVIMNLLTNAVKYTERGNVTLTIKVQDKTSDSVKIFVAVADTGIGIKKDDIGRLYDSFERLDEVRNHNIEGTGLGMSIVSSLLELMGSKLAVQSTYRVGSVFSFVIEQVVADATPIGNYEKRLTESRRNRNVNDMIKAPGARVLLVDDNDMNLKVAKNLLKLCGIKPDMVTSGADAIERMKGTTYDIVFLDHMMPGLDGVETLHKLMEGNLVPDETTMIALTANAVVGAREKYLEAGFKDYLSKPIELRELVEKLRLYLPADAYASDEPVITDDPAITDNPVITDIKEDDIDIESEYYTDEEFGVMEFSAVTDDEDEESPSDDGSVTSFVFDFDRLTAAGVDVESGIAFCAGDESFYREIVKDYIEGYPKKAKEIENAYNASDWKTYRILVHAAKSTSRTIGAKALGEAAFALETAAKENDLSYIKSHHEEFMEAYGKLVSGQTMM